MRCAEIGAEGVPIAPMLAGFNLGVEAAQLSIIVVTLPFLWLMSRTPRYARQLMPVLSVATAMTGAVWFAGRLSNGIRGTFPRIRPRAVAAYTLGWLNQRDRRFGT